MHSTNKTKIFFGLTNLNTFLLLSMIVLFCMVIDCHGAIDDGIGEPVECFCPGDAPNCTCNDCLNQCLPGQYGYYGSGYCQCLDCMPCSPGYIFSDDLEKCKCVCDRSQFDCPSEVFNYSTCSCSCYACPFGMTGCLCDIPCEPCPGGTTYGGNIGSCLCDAICEDGLCGVNQYHASGCECTTCNPATCPAGQYRDAGDCTCRTCPGSCPAGSNRKDPGSCTCSPCTNQCSVDQSFSNECTCSACNDPVTCPAGQYRDAGDCTCRTCPGSCPAGSNRKDPGSCTCSPCTNQCSVDQSFSNECTCSACNDPVTCPAGQYRDAGDCTCRTCPGSCPVGSNRKDPGSCTCSPCTNQCSVDQSFSNECTCSACNDPVTCPAGQYRDAGDCTCRTCPGSCPAGSNRKDPGSCTCSPCTNQCSVDQSFSNECTCSACNDPVTCPAGQYRDAGDCTCRTCPGSCPAGSNRKDPGSCTCSPCTNQCSVDQSFSNECTCSACNDPVTCPAGQYRDAGDCTCKLVPCSLSSVECNANNQHFDAPNCACVDCPSCQHGGQITTLQNTCGCDCGTSNGRWTGAQCDTCPQLNCASGQISVETTCTCQACSVEHCTSTGGTIISLENQCSCQCPANNAWVEGTGCQCQLQCPSGFEPSATCTECVARTCANIRSCNSHGTWNDQTCQCECDDLWAGLSCQSCILQCDSVKSTITNQCSCECKHDEYYEYSGDNCNCFTTKIKVTLARVSDWILELFEVDPIAASDDPIITSQIIQSVKDRDPKFDSVTNTLSVFGMELISFSDPISKADSKHLKMKIAWSECNRDIKGFVGRQGLWSEMLEWLRSGSITINGEEMPIVGVEVGALPSDLCEHLEGEKEQCSTFISSLNTSNTPVSFSIASLTSIITLLILAMTLIN